MKNWESYLCTPEVTCFLEREMKSTTRESFFLAEKAKHFLLSRYNLLTGNKRLASGTKTLACLITFDSRARVGTGYRDSLQIIESRKGSPINN